MRIEGTGQGVATTGAGQARDHARLVDAAQQFEAMLLGQMLKPFSEGAAKLDGSEEDGEGSGSTLSSFGTEAVAKAIAKGGGLGIARQIVTKVTAEKEISLEKSHGTNGSSGKADKLK